MIFIVEISESARKDYYNLDSKTQDRIKQGLKELEINPFKSRSSCDIKMLHGNKSPRFYRLRIGDYRLIYTVDENIVRVTKILSRENAYDWM